MPRKKTPKAKPFDYQHCPANRRKAAIHKNGRKPPLKGWQIQWLKKYIDEAQNHPHSAYVIYCKAKMALRWNCSLESITRAVDGEYDRYYGWA